MHTRLLYLTSAHRYADLVSSIPADAWESPALGVWDLRALVGHTSRALTTVLDYLGQPADEVACETAADYFIAALATAGEQVHAQVAARGVAAGQALGDDPVAGVRTLVASVEAALSIAGDPLVTTIAGGMRLEIYLETRIFELTVHCLDIADALGVDAEMPADAAELTLATLATMGARTGRAPAAIRMLTGRGGSSFSLL